MVNRFLTDVHEDFRLCVHGHGNFCRFRGTTFSLEPAEQLASEIPESGRPGDAMPRNVVSLVQGRSAETQKLGRLLESHDLLAFERATSGVPFYWYHKRVFNHTKSR
jgi:hypothetical protein